MDEDEWRVSDLLDDSQPVVEDAKLAKQIVEILNVVKTSDLDIRVPKAAVEFAENTLSDWFEIIAEIEKKRGNIPYLVNRELYSPGADGAPDWNQGLRLEEWEHWLSDPDFMEDFNIHYPPVKQHESTLGNTPLSGYYNRIFPVKFVLRVLAAMSLIGTHEVSRGQEEWMEESERISLEYLRKNALQHALYAREYLLQFDRKSGSLKNAGSEISVGFPEASEKAKERFVAQFVCTKRKNRLSGALIDMGFANMPKLMMWHLDGIHFTKPGLEFALLPNPILDGGFNDWKDYFESGKRFSDDEIAYLLNHFKVNVPSEWELMSRIAQSIDSGYNRPQLLEQNLLTMYSLEKAKMSQMRNGAVSRMEEIGLIKRERKGREVTYSLTNLCIGNGLTE